MNTTPVNTLPTDSVLRRHFEQLAANLGLPGPPQDSILLRHYLQTLDARKRDAAFAATPSPSPTPKATASASDANVRVLRTSAPPPAPATARVSPPPKADAPKGWFTRLVERFVGR